MSSDCNNLKNIQVAVDGPFQAFNFFGNTPSLPKCHGFESVPELLRFSPVDLTGELFGLDHDGSAPSDFAPTFLSDVCHAP